MMKRRTVKDLHADWMKKPEYAKAYDELGPEFEVASAIIEARTKAKLTQDELARRMDTTQTVVARLESGRSMPSTRTLQRVASAIGMKMQVSFIYGKGFGVATVSQKSGQLRAGALSQKSFRAIAASSLSQKGKTPSRRKEK